MRALKIIFLSLICAALLLALLVVTKDYARRNQKKREELNEYYESIYDDVIKRQEEYEKNYEQQKEERKNKEKNYSPYQRFADKSMSSTIFFLGDRVVYGSGVNPTAESFRVLLKNKYVKAFPGYTESYVGSAQNGYINALTLSEEKMTSYVKNYKLHLLILSIGSRDDYTDFGFFYERIIRLAKEYNPKSDVICIIQHGQTDEDAIIIKNLCLHYNLLCVDMREHFEGREAELTTAENLPNAEGNKIYADVLFDVMKAAVDEERKTEQAPDDGVYLTSEEIEMIRNYVK